MAPPRRGPEVTAPKRRAVPPFEVRRDAAGFPVAISRGGWDVLHLHSYGSQRTIENVDMVVARLNAAPLDWPSRYNGRKRRASTAASTRVRESGLMGSTGEDMP